MKRKLKVLYCLSVLVCVVFILACEKATGKQDKLSHITNKQEFIVHTKVHDKAIKEKKTASTSLFAQAIAGGTNTVAIPDMTNVKEHVVTYNNALNKLMCLNKMTQDDILSFTNSAIPIALRYRLAKDVFYGRWNLNALTNQASMVTAVYNMYSNSAIIFLSILKDTKDENEKNDVLLYLARAYRVIRDFSASFKYLNEIIERGDSGISKNEYSSAFKALGELYNETGKYEESREIYRRYIESANTETERQSGKLKIAYSYLQEDRKTGIKKFEEFIRDCKDKSLHQYQSALKTYANICIIEPEIRKIRPKQKPANRIEEGKIYRKVNEEVRKKYYDNKGNLTQQTIEEIQNKIDKM